MKVLGQFDRHKRLMGKHISPVSRCEWPITDVCRLSYVILARLRGGDKRQTSGQQASYTISCYSPLGEEVLMKALPYEQAEDHLAEAVFIIRDHFQEPNAHGFRPG